MFKYLHNGTYHTDTSKAYMETLGFDEYGIESVLNQKAYEEAQEPKALSALKKRQGAKLNGKQVSLNESNQNGIAAVLTGLALADEVGANMFPMNFNAESPSGNVTIAFTDLASFKQFALQFMAERQAFFA